MFLTKRTKLLLSNCLCILVAVGFTNAAILTPPYFNLVANKRVAATATCGEGVREPELYCKLTGSSATDREASSYANLIQGQYCEYCDPSDPQKNHHANYSIDGTDKWWQSPPLSRSLDFNQVNLTIDFGQEFHVAYIYIKMANSPRPGVWSLEKSVDYGETFQPWQYFADTPSDCYNFFNATANRKIGRDDDVICTTDYSKVLPVEGGEILVSLVNNRPSAKNFTHADLLQKWTRATNVRLRLMRTKNLLGHLMAVAKQDPTVTRRYFYSIRDISIGGRCVCNGHAQHCEASNPYTPDKLICRCSHNTCGDQCETCCDGFVQKKWQPNREGQEFECEPCQCYGHSNQCVYDPEVDENNLSIDIHGNYSGGGRCVDCEHNTQGINCHECVPGYYRPFGVSISSVDACRKCDCENPYSTGNCAPLTGECECKIQYTGYKCQECAQGYTDWPTCGECDCHIHGRLDQTCKAPCKCKFGYLGPNCDKCMERYYGFPNCTACDCDREGTLDYNCNKATGQCVCRAGYTGVRCDQCADGYFGERMCTLCNCDVGTEREVCDKLDGRCICAANYAGERCNECAPGFYNFPQCLPCECDEEGSRGTSCTFYGSQQQCNCKEGRSGSKCDQCAPGYYKYPECIECQCDNSGTIGQSCDPITGKCNCKSNFNNDKCSECAPDFFNYPFCERCSCHPKGTAEHFPGCNKELRMSAGIVCPCKEYVTGRQCDKCKDRYFGLGNDPEKGCSKCECSRDGTLNELELCDLNSGQCVCKLFVDAVACNECKSGFFSLERNNIFGCQECGCHPGTSYDNNCDRQTGQCACLPNMVGQKCDQPAPGHYIPDLHQLKYEIEDGLANNKQVRYTFDENLFPRFSWKGYVHLNKIVGEVSQNVSVSKSGTYRMVVRYLNKNLNISELSVRVRDLSNEGDEQRATLYLLPNSQPSFETVTVDKINALILELENAEYEFSFKSDVDNLYIDYFVLIPSHYYESTVLKQDVIKACEDYRTNETCIQYNYPSIENFGPYRLFNPETDTIDSNRMVNLDVFKEFNHSYVKPAIAHKLNNQNSITRNVKFPSQGQYVLLLDFMNLNDDGQQVNVEISHSDSNRRQNGKVYLYKCNITTLCREVVLSNEFNEPLAIDGKDSASITIRAGGREVLINQITLVPKDRFHVNYIKMAPYCLVKNKRCTPLEYSRFVFNRIEAETNTNAIRQDPSRSSAAYDYIPLDKVVYLHNYYPEVTVQVDQQNRQPGSEQMLLVHYYQPNHPNVGVTVFLDRQTNGTFTAAYCPSTSGCRAIVKFAPNTDTFSADYINTLTYQLNQNGQDIWIDYALLASANDVTPDIFSFIPIDQTSDFITRCASQQHFHIDFYTSDFCDRSVMSLAVKYNDGALPCNCHPQGTKEEAVEICSTFGGKCDCRDNVIGRQCNRCKTGYFGFPNCRQCDCPTGNCDDVTGECVSPPNSENSQCLDGYYGFHRIYGCEECNCELDGTVNRDTICDKQTGQCHCRENTDGLRCDRCKAGYWNFPRCEQCDCHEEGALTQICDPLTAQCLCKENAYGDRCEHCKPGTFNLESRNPKGCTPCFCFGQTSQCIMADLYYGPVKDMRGEWRLANAKTSANQSDISLEIIKSDDEEEGGLSLGHSNADNDSPIDTIYWSAPSSYTGNKVTSYGGTVKYSVRLSAPENSQLSPQIKPDLILVGANMTLAHTSLNQPSADNSIFSNSIDLIESKFNHLHTGSPATREQLMMVLASLSEVKIRGTYYSRLHPSSLVEVTFDNGVEFAGNLTVEASGAEMCYCPPYYRGYSCEACEYGYYKVKGNGPGLFNCVPCNCNGHSDQCDQETGECLNCRDNTEGKMCEKCKLGHYLIEYGNGASECRLCPCPGPYETNVFADSCNYDANAQKVYYCACAPGYYGQFCERCAPGFYGDPTIANGKCLPCECNGNIDLGTFDSCDQRTGACLRCLNNTAGIHCERCADWHWGDPIVAKSCKACECDQLGTQQCDVETGECVCKPGVIGYNCASCGNNMWGFALGDGCMDCDCDPIGSVSSQCDSQTGKCTCKPGVGGKKCDRCLEDHWNFTTSGCQKCKCEKSGVKVTNTGGFACNSTTGHCTCIEGVKGQLCDRCDDRWVLVKHVGCKKCDTCVNTLLDDVAELVVKADGIESGNKDSSLTFKANSKLMKLESDFQAIKDSVDPSQYDQTPLVLLQRSIKTVQNDLLGLKLMTEYNINDKIKLLTKLLADAELFNKDISDLRIKLDILDQIIDDLDREDDKNYKNITDEQLLIYESLVDQIVKRDFTSTIDRYKQLVDEFDTANKTVQELLASFQNQSGQVDSIKAKNTYIQNSLMELKSYVDKAKNLEKFRDRDVEFKAYYDNLEKIRNESSQLQVNSVNTLKEIEEVIKKGQDKLVQSNKDLADLNSKVEDLQELYKDHDTKYLELKNKCQLAEQNSFNLYKMANDWKNKVLSAQQGLEAFEMVKSYERIADSLEQAHNHSKHVLDQYKDAKNNLDELSTQTDELKSRNEKLTAKLNQELEKKVKAESDYVRLNGQYSELDSRAKQLNKSLLKLDEWINKTVESDQTLAQLKRELDNQQADLTSSERVADDLIRRIQSLDTLRNSIKPPETNPDETSTTNDQQLVASIENSIESLKANGPAINQTIKKLLDENNFNAELEKISKDIYDLRILIESTRQIANNIKVAVNFNDSTLLNLKPPVDLHPAMTTTGSIYIKTRDSYAPIALIYNESNPNEYISLYLQQGRPHFQYKLSSDDSAAAATVISTNEPINNDEWHKLEIERTGRTAKLRVYGENSYAEAEGESDHGSVVLNLDSNNAKFLLGQFPFANIPDDLRTVAAYNNQFRGAMDAFRFNGHQMGLWNYLQASNIKGELNRKFKAQSDVDELAATSSEEAGVYFMEGDAFMCRNGSKIKFSGRNRPNLDITVRFKTESPNGLLWLWYNDERHYLAIYLQSGHINVAFSNSAENKLTLFERFPANTSYRLDDNKYHTIKVTVSRNPKANVISEVKFTVVERFDENRENTLADVTHQTNNKYYTISNGKQCIGGILATDRESIFKDAQFDSFTGCYVSLTITMVGLFENLNLNERLHKSGIKSYNVVPDCPTTSDQCEVRKSSQPVHVQFDVSRRDPSHEAIGVSFVTSSHNGVLFYRSRGENSLLAQLRDGRVVLTVYGAVAASVRSKGTKLNDNRLHHVYVRVKDGLVELRVDNKLEGSASIDESSDPSVEGKLFVAGVPTQNRPSGTAETFDNFEGCIIEVLYDDKKLDYSNAASKSSSVRLSKCFKTQLRTSLSSMTGYKDLQNSVSLNRYSQTIKASQQNQINDLGNEEECALSKQYDTSQMRAVGLRFGLSRTSRLEVQDSFPIAITTFVSFKFRTLQPDGVMFYASGGSDSADFISVWLQDGYVNYAFDCGSGFMHLRSRRIYNDGRYHTVTLKRDRQAGAMIVSDRTNSTVLEKLESVAQGDASSLTVAEPYYFGGIPDSDRSQLPAAQTDLINFDPFIGCMSDFNIAYKILRKNLEKIELMSCSNNHESGIFFPGQLETAFASLGNSMVSLSEPFDVSFEIKSRTKNGVLLFINPRSTSDASDTSNYALLELVNGDLIYKMVIDDQESVVRYQPEQSRAQLCNSSWIRVRVRRDDRGLIGLELRGVESTSALSHDLVALMSKLSSHSVLYLGALPNKSLYGEISQTNEPFVGCIRDLVVNGRVDSSSLPKKVLLDMSLESGVLNYCPLK